MVADDLRRRRNSLAGDVLATRVAPGFPGPGGLLLLAGLVMLVGLFGSTQAQGQFPEEPELQNWTGSGSVACGF